MIYLEKPRDFNSKFDIVSCFVEHSSQILLLHRSDYTPQGNTWGMPAGKVYKGEKLLDALMREIFEETGIKLLSSQLSYFEKLYIKFPDYDFIYHIFYTKLDQRQEVVITDGEHKDFIWVSPSKALDMPLIQDLDACIKLFYKL